MVALAGPEAERRFVGRRNNIRAASDDGRAVEVALKADGHGAAATAYLKWLRLKVAEMLAVPHVWAQVQAVAAALLERDTLGGDEMISICRAAVRNLGRGD